MLSLCVWFFFPLLFFVFPRAHGSRSFIIKDWPSRKCWLLSWRNQDKIFHVVFVAYRIKCSPSCLHHKQCCNQYKFGGKQHACSSKCNLLFFSGCLPSLWFGSDFKRLLDNCIIQIIWISVRGVEILFAFLISFFQVRQLIVERIAFEGSV